MTPEQRRYKASFMRALKVAAKVTALDPDLIADRMEDYEVFLLRSHVASLEAFVRRVTRESA